MSAARVIPMEDTAQLVTIDSTFGASPKAVIIPAGQVVNFTNNSGATITIQFEPNPPGPTLFTNVPPLVNGATNSQTPQAANGNGAVNYHVVDAGGTQHGPYAIQVGNGPLYIQVTYSQALGAAQCIPSPAVIPYQGSLEMISNDYNYSVTWPTSFGDPFTPALTSIGIGASNNIPHKETANLADYAYKITKTGIAEGTGSGGGTVRVKGT